jgi:[protein-PII] uridylyltransferase
MAMMRPNVLAAKDRLARGLEDSFARHRNGCPGAELCELMTNLRDAVIQDLVEATLAELKEDGPRGLLGEIALVAHGGYGRREIAPYSDVDLMILYRKGAQTRLSPVAERVVRDVFDVGLVLGHSVRTVSEACRLASRDATICASLIDARLLMGNADLFAKFQHRFRKRVAWRRSKLLTGMGNARSDERGRYGETVSLLEPNIKRSQGTLRDLQLLRWIGFARYGTNDPAELLECGVLSEPDYQALRRAREFLLWLRNDLHFHARQANDVLSRSEQLRLAEFMNYEAAGGLLPVERFMRVYFRHTNQVSHIVRQFFVRATRREAAEWALTVFFGHRVDKEFIVGPGGMVTTRHGRQRLQGNLAGIMRMIDLANLHDVSIAPFTWEFIRREAASLSAEPSAEMPAEALRHFISLLAHPARIGETLRKLHDLSILDRFLPDFARARGLLQFNQYHKYTVDEHSIRAVEFAEQLLTDAGPVGHAYRSIRDKHLLHLALLLHDLGKGNLEDHREVGLRIATEMGHRLGLKTHETEVVKFLVHKHLCMNHLALRRDTTDEELVVRFAVLVGTPEMLQMLYVLTACDLAAVGPDVWDGWKCELLTDLYHRAMQQLAGEIPASMSEALVERRRSEIRQSLGPRAAEPWFVRTAESLTPSYLSATSAQQAAEDLLLLHELSLRPDGVLAKAHYQVETATVQFTVGTSERVVHGIFHRLTGALTSLGLEIRSAQIHTLSDGLVLDRFWVHDPDFSGPPPDERLSIACRALEKSLLAESAETPMFRRRWQAPGQRKLPGPKPQTRVNTDNNTSDRYTIIDVFGYDRTGMLYAIARTLFEIDLSVWRAKIGTHIDQVLDVFYVTDAQGHKITDDARLEAISERLLAVIDEAQ